MKRFILIILALSLFAPVAMGQGSGAAGSTAAALKRAAALPAEPCTNGQVRYLTTGTPGGYVCVSSAWVVMGGGGGVSGADPAATVGLSAVNGVATTFMRSDASPALSQAIAPTWTGAHLWNGVTGTYRRNSIGTTSTDGIILENTTAAAAGAQQYSPRIRWTGQGWKTTATAASQRVDMTAELIPCESTTAPFGVVTFSSQVNGGGYTTGLGISSGGVIGTQNSCGNAPATFNGVGTMQTSGGLRSGLWVSGDDIYLRGNSGDQVRYVNQSGFRIRSDYYYGFDSGAGLTSPDTFIMRGGAAATVRFGQADAATAVPQITTVQSVSGVSDTAGANWTRDGSRGTGTGAGGAHIWRVAPAGSSGSSQNALVEAMRLDGNGVRLPEITSAATPSANNVYLYAKDKSGVSTLYYKKDDGTEGEIGAASTWNGIASPSGNQALTMGSGATNYTTTWTWGTNTSSSNMFTLTTGSNDSGINSYLVSIETPGASNSKWPFRVAARGSTSFFVHALGSVSAPGAGSNSERWGYSAASAGDDSLAVGNAASAGGLGTIAIGRSATVGSVQHSIAIGYGANAAHQPSLVFGTNAISTAAGQVVFGDDTNANTRFTDFYFGSGVTDSSPNSITFNATGKSGSDQAGVSIAIAGGKATGLGGSGSVKLQTSVAGTTGSTLQGLVDRYIVNGPRKPLTDAQTDLFEVALPTLKGCMGTIRYEIYATDGTDVQIRRGVAQYSAVNKAGAYTSEIAVVSEAASPSAGTLTATFAVTSGTNKITISVTPTGSLTETLYYIVYTIENNSEQAITIL